MVVVLSDTYVHDVARRPSDGQGGACQFERWMENALMKRQRSPHHERFLQTARMCAIPILNGRQSFSIITFISAFFFKACRSRQSAIPDHVRPTKTNIDMLN